MRIAIAAESFLPRVDGVTRTVAALTAHLARRGHDALVVAPGAGGPQEVDGFPVTRVRGVTGLFYPDLCIAPAAPAAGRVLDRFQPDVVHLASPALLGAAVLRAARRRDVPVAGHYQTHLPGYARHYGGSALAPGVWALMRRLHNRCTVTYAPTAGLADELRAHGFQRVRVSGRGVDTRLFRPGRPGAGVAERLWPPGDGPRVLCVSRLAAEKGLLDLVRAAADLPGLRFLLVGDGPLRRSLERQAGPNLALAGLVVGEALADVYAAADLFAFPSATETFGQVVQEAMAAGLPVVGRRAGGTAVLVEDGVTGALVERTPDFTHAVAALAADRAARARLGAEGRRRALRRSWSAVFDRLLDDYEELAERGAVPARRPAAPRPGRRAAAFFDVDRTLLRGSCFLALAPAFRRAGMLRRRALLRAGAHQAMFTLRGCPADRLEAAARRGAAVVAGMDVGQVTAVGRAAVPGLVVPRLHPQALRAIEAHRAAGHAVVLVSSAPEEIVAEIAAHVGADAFAGSRVDVRDGRYTGGLSHFCHGLEKVRALRAVATRLGIDLRASTAYADSAADIPMLDVVGRAICVNPDRALVQAARARGWEVRRFAAPRGRRGAPVAEPRAAAGEEAARLRVVGDNDR